MHNYLLTFLLDSATFAAEGLCCDALWGLMGTGIDPVAQEFRKDGIEGCRPEKFRKAAAQSVRDNEFGGRAVAVRGQLRKSCQTLLPRTVCGSQCWRPSGRAGEGCVDSYSLAVLFAPPCKLVTERSRTLGTTSRRCAFVSARGANRRITICSRSVPHSLRPAVLSPSFRNEVAATRQLPEGCCYLMVACGRS